MRDVCCPLFLLLLLLLLLTRKWTRAKKRAERTRGPRVHDRRGNGDRDRSPSRGARKSLDLYGWNLRNKKARMKREGTIVSFLSESIDYPGRIDFSPQSINFFTRESRIQFVPLVACDRLGQPSRALIRVKTLAFVSFPLFPPCTFCI